ncbi:FUSC family protein [Orrella daihaiensis]|uniref:FUSC family protein n=1 Tax=Orrella daihaiensis TaxID=2782176 RepID=A0ABY4AL30_9BURK|nr:FUSC family membrane protein [Orrella daihaiensis]UOD50999.1 FUSC family protein [Orrella daihaiensis]
MSNSRLSSIQRFVYSHHFVSGVRRGAGILLVFALGLLLPGAASQALIAALGAACVALIDQPGPLTLRVREMFGGLVLGTLAVSLTGITSHHPLWLLIAVVGQTFFFSMFAVYGKRGAIIGLSCLVLTVVTMHSALTPDQVLDHALVTLSGAAIYILFSILASRPLQVREEEQSLSVALMATADYVAARAEMYDADADLDERYRQLIATQATMSDQHQAARDMILRRMSKDAVQSSPRRRMVWNVFIDMVNMLDLLVGTHTDYMLLQRALGRSDTLIFMRDALLKISLELERIASAVIREKSLLRRNSVKAELRALEYDIEVMKRQGFATQNPETYALCVQILRRLRNVNRCVERMLTQTSMPADLDALNPAQLDTSLSDFLSRQSFSPKLFSSNLRLDSAPFRFSLRVAMAVAVGLAIGLAIPEIGPHGYWIVLTIIIIMKPAFSLTRERNTARLIGTLIGCALAFLLFYLTTDTQILLLTLVVTLITGFSFILVNYLVASVFNTVTVLIMLHFLLPETFGLVGERAIDTTIGSLVALAFSYVLPWWEARSLPSLADAAIRANETYLKTGLQQLTPRGQDSKSASANDWPLARRNTMVAFSNFAQAFYRMMGEPPSRQQHIAEYNNLLIQNHVLASEVAAAIEQLAALDELPASAVNFLQDMDRALHDRDLELASQDVNLSLGASKGADWVFSMKQLQRAVQSIVREAVLLKELDRQGPQ